MPLALSLAFTNNALPVSDFMSILKRFLKASFLVLVWRCQFLLGEKEFPVIVTSEAKLRLSKNSEMIKNTALIPNYFGEIAS